jgi:general secretion pathway protein L
VGAQSARLRQVLAALLEEHVLDEAEALHFALEPGARAQTPAWVAVCRRDWLAAHLQALQAAGRAALRIVPELAPQAGPARLVAIGTPENAQLLACGGDLPAGAQALPLAPAALPLLPADEAAQVQSEPAVAALAEQLLRQPVAIVQPAARLLAAAASPWDLAQLEFTQSGSARGLRRLVALQRELLHAPRWRPARWGVALLVLVHLAGINLLAWQTKTDLTRRQAAVRAVFTESFPKVPVVIDAPAQMAREVALLRQRSGATSPRDLEPLLSAFGTPTLAGDGPSALEFASGELRAKGLQLSADELASFNQSLSPLGYRASAEDGGLRLQVQQE